MKTNSRNVKICILTFIVAICFVMATAFSGYAVSADGGSAVKPVMEEGASVRFVGEDGKLNGLRFRLSLSAADYQALEGDESAEVTYGILIAPYDYIEEYGALNEENVFGADAVYDWAILNEETGSWDYTGSKTRIINLESDILTVTGDRAVYAGSIVDVKEENLARVFTAAGYIKSESEGVITYSFNDSVLAADGTVYPADGEHNVNRSMAYVAQMAIAAGQDENGWLQTNYVDKVNTVPAGYTVEHYFEQVSGEYIVDEGLTQTLSSTIDAVVTAEPADLSEKPQYEYAAQAEGTVNGVKVLADGSTVLKLYYNLVSHTVTFDSNGGSAVEAQQVKHGGYATAPETPTNGNSAFEGWLYNGEIFNFLETPVTADITLTAKWETYAKGVMKAGYLQDAKYGYNFATPAAQSPGFDHSQLFTGVGGTLETYNRVQFNAAQSEYTGAGLAHVKFSGDLLTAAAEMDKTVLVVGWWRVDLDMSGNYRSGVRPGIYNEDGLVEYLAGDRFDPLFTDSARGRLDASCPGNGSSFSYNSTMTYAIDLSGIVLEEGQYFALGYMNKNTQTGFTYLYFMSEEDLASFYLDNYSKTSSTALISLAGTGLLYMEDEGKKYKYDGDGADAANAVNNNSFAVTEFGNIRESEGGAITQPNPLGLYWGNVNDVSDHKGDLKFSNTLIKELQARGLTEITVYAVNGASTSTSAIDVQPVHFDGENYNDLGNGATLEPASDNRVLVPITFSIADIVLEEGDFVSIGGGSETQRLMVIRIEFNSAA